MLLLISMAAVQTQAQPKSADSTLAEERQWRRLLHFRAGAGQSDVLDSRFFFSPTGNTDPLAELQAAIRAFDAVPRGAAGEQCRFPARYFWLTQKGFRFEASLDDCQSLNDWAKPQSLRSVSLLMVSGYFGNPASTFGH